MSSIFWILGGFLANMIIGASVWAAIDDDSNLFYAGITNARHRLHG